jgi:ubiquinone/menaquinone biosynthesis C-methylase UbiE
MPATTVSERKIKQHITAHYDPAAEHYERHIVPYMTIFSQHMVEMARLKPGEDVLDVATGTGTAARLAARAVGPAGAVTGVDLSDGQVRIAAQVADRLKLPHLAFGQGDAEALAFASDHFDAVLCAFGLNHLPERAQALAEMRRVLRPGGRLVVSAWHRALADRDPPFRPRIVFEKALDHYAPRQWPEWLDKLWERWDGELGSPEHLTRRLFEAGFHALRVEAVSHAHDWNGPSDYFAYKSAWGENAWRLAELAQAERAAFEAECLGALGKLPPEAFRYQARVLYGIGVR